MQKRQDVNLVKALPLVAIIAVITLIGNWVGYKVSPLEALPGMLILLGFVLIGLILTKIIPIYVPTIAYIATIALVSTMPGVPFSGQIGAYVSKVNFLALATPIIAFASIGMGKDLDDFKQIGWKIVVAALISLFAVYFSAALIAEVTLRIQGMPP